MLEPIADSILLASGVARPRPGRRAQGVVDSPATHDPERAWLAADFDRRHRGAGRAERRRAMPLFWRRRRGQVPGTDTE